MSRLNSTELGKLASSALLLLLASCARSSLYLSDWTDGEGGGTGGSAGSALGRGSARGGGSGGIAAEGGRSSLLGGSGGVGGSSGGAGGGAGAGQGGNGGTALPRGGSAGQAGGAAGAVSKPPLLHCRDGVLDVGEECDAGEGPYAHPAIELRTSGIVIELSPVAGDTDAVNFYDYFDKSSHTGNENVSGSKLYFYRRYDESTTYLFTHHGIDFEATGYVQPEGKATFTISGLPESAYVLVSDDDGEVVKDSATTVSAEWEFGLNTDGLVLGGIPFPGNWHIVLHPEFAYGIDTFTALSGDGYRTGLALVRDVELIASDEAGGCRRDCSLPFCGDGRLDAGETCDDGNDDDFDTCASCKPGPGGEPTR